jgi:carbonic anhydrase/acetyltransferase-like protein (isoleucine patch superfamily)
MAYPEPVIMPYHGVWPRRHPRSLIVPGAAVIGDVELGEDSSIWFNATVRGDDGPIRIGPRSNIQDNSIVHVSTVQPTIIGADVTIGHAVHLHACVLQDRCLIGSGAIILDEATVETGAQVAAGALVSPGKTVKSGELWAGVPAKKLRDLTDEEVDWIAENAAWYVREMHEYLEEINKAP